MHIVLSTDENYAQHTGVTIQSLLHNKRSSASIIIYVIDDNLSSISRSNLQKIVENYNIPLFFLKVDSEILNQLPVLNHLSRTACYRLAIPYILPSTVHKVLYLDTDMIIRNDITELWDIDISKYHAAAVIDLGIDEMDKEVMLRYTLGLPENEPYFNSGLLLINLSKWREDHISEKVITFISNNSKSLYFLDQDGLNSVLWGKWLLLHPKWNVYRVLVRKYYTWKERSLLEPIFIEAVRNPSIIHFTGALKPWHYGCYLPYVEEYYHYLSMTPWKKYRIPNTNIHGFFKKYRWLLRRYVMDFIYKAFDRLQ